MYHRFRIALLGGRPDEVDPGVVVGLGVSPEQVHHAEAVHRRSVSFFGGLRQGFQCLHLPAFSLQGYAVDVLPLGITHVRGDPDELGPGFNVPDDTVASVVKLSEGPERLRNVEVSRLPQPEEGLVDVLLSAVAVEAHGADHVLRQRVVVQGRLHEQFEGLLCVVRLVEVPGLLIPVLDVPQVRVEAELDILAVFHHDLVDVALHVCYLLGICLNAVCAAVICGA